MVLMIRKSRFIPQNSFDCGKRKNEKVFSDPGDLFKCEEVVKNFIIRLAVVFALYRAGLNSITTLSSHTHVNLARKR